MSGTEHDIQQATLAQALAPSPHPAAVLLL
jgi:hypothetical protein